MSAVTRGIRAFWSSRQNPAGELAPWWRWTVLGAGAAILAWRRPDQIVNPQLWAEDGIFFFQARVFGAEALAMELAGYFHLATRLIAALAAAVDPEWVPHVFVGAALALTLYTMSRALAARCPLPFKAGCALVLVLVPDASEVILNAVNLNWVFSAGFVLLLISAEPMRPRQRVHDVAAAILLGLSGPVSILVTPMFAWRAFVRRTRLSAALAILVAGCAVVQAVSIVHHPQPLPANAAFDPAAFASFPGQRIAASLLLGAIRPVPFTTGPAIVLTVLLAAGILALMFRAGPARTERIAIGLAFAVLLAGSMARTWHSLPVLCVPGNATRYVYPLQVLVLWLLLANARSPSRAVRVGAPLLVLWSVAINTPRLRIAPIPDLRWSDYAGKLRAGEAVDVPINPAGWTFPFPERKKP